MSHPELLKPYEPPQRSYTNRQKQYFKKRDPEKSPVIKHEEILQKQVCQYLRAQYPNVIFRSDTDSGRWQYSKQELHKKVALHSSKSFPDLFIYEPMMHGDKQYYGLALELKTEGTSVIMKIGPRKGRLSTDKHIQEQAVMLKALIKRGYYANFAVGLDDAIRLIDWYFKRPQTAELF